MLALVSKVAYPCSTMIRYFIQSLYCIQLNTGQIGLANYHVVFYPSFKQCSNFTGIGVVLLLLLLTEGQTGKHTVFGTDGGGQQTKHCFILHCTVDYSALHSFQRQLTLDS